MNLVQTIKCSCTDFMFTDYVSCSSVCYISFNVNFYILQCSNVQNNKRKTQEQTLMKRPKKSARERIKLIFFMTEAFHIMELGRDVTKI